MHLTVDNGQLPMGWEIFKLGEVCQLDKFQSIHENLPYVGMENIESNTARFIGSTESKSVKSSTFKFSTDHILYARLRPYLNKVIAPEFEGHCSTEIFPIKPSKCLDRNFLLYWFLMDSTVGRINATCTGARMPRANMNSVFEFKFPVPSLPEQKRIVAILDEVFEGIDRAIANTEKNLANARELFESYLNAIFTQKGDGWEEKKLEKLASKIGSGATPRGGQDAYKIEGITLIRSLNIHDRRFKTKDLAYIDYEQAKKLANVVVEEGDVLLNITGASIARSCVAPSEYLPARVNQHVSIIRPDPNQISSHFLIYLITSKPYKERLLMTGDKAGATRQALTKAQIQDFSVHFPNLNEQELIVKKFDLLETETQRLEAIYRQKLAALQELKQSILQKAFTGELTADTGETLYKVNSLPSVVLVS